MTELEKIVVSDLINSGLIKTTHTGQYPDFKSQTPCKLKTAWVTALYHRANKNCSSKTSFLKRVDKVKRFMSWHGYPPNIRRSLIQRLKIDQHRN